LLSDVEDVCDRVVIYYGGKIQAMGTLKELLATPDVVRITTPVLARETMERALEIIRRDIDGDKIRIDNPTQNLESYFLDVVQKARAAAEQTSGATSGHSVAEYLRGEGETKPGTDRVLERLTAPQAKPVVVETSAAQPTETVDSKKLAALTRHEPEIPAPNPTATPAAPAAAEPKADLSKANEKLSSLLGKPKQ
jgi:ABC-2 type transport system ATP-binding protein